MQLAFALVSFAFTAAPVTQHERWRALITPSMCTASTAAYLTREDGKNGKLQGLLDAHGVPWEELPCIAAERLAGFDELATALETAAEEYSWIVITSPEAATVFVDALSSANAARRSADNDREVAIPKLATVGAGTAKVLAGAGLAADFVPSKATGKVLSAELPAPSDGCPVLYPASALAADVVEGGLNARGIPTRRINTYTTVPAEWDAADLAAARSAQVVTFASPSAVRVWADRAGTGALAVCIGETSAAECVRVGFAEERVRCPDSPGVEAWAGAIAALDVWT